MLFSYELKKIWRRVSPLLVLIILLATAVITVAVTAIFFREAPADPADVSTQYAELEAKIAAWDKDSKLRTNINETFETFYKKYKTMNSCTQNGIGLVDSYREARTAFQDFYHQYYERYIYNGEQDNIKDYLLVQEKYYKDFNDILSTLAKLFDKEYGNGDEDKIAAELRKTNPAWDDANLQTILKNLFFVQNIEPEELSGLKAFFTEHPAGQVGYDYTNAFDYVQNRFWLAVDSGSTKNDQLSKYKGFENYPGKTAATRAMQLADYRLANPETDYAAPFAFSNIYNNGNQISLFDFVFTNLEMAMIPVTLLVMIWAACAFFTDNYQNTLITPVAVGKKRSTIIVTKMLAVMMLAVLALIVLTGVYLTCGLVFFKAYITTNILCLFNGTTAMTIPAIGYFILYLLNLVFKILPIIAICGLFSFSKMKPFVIIGFTVLIYAAVIAANALLGGFGFYQFVPLMGLDPIRYFGAQLLFAPMPSSYNIWYTFPAMLAITVILYWALIRKFRKHDF